MSIRRELLLSVNSGNRQKITPHHAALAQLVVRHLAMVEVTSSSLVCRLHEIHPANQNG